jgi:hypothetical protein
MVDIIVSNSETLQDSVVSIYPGYSRAYLGESFSCPGFYILESCKFFLSIYSGTPTGNLYAKLYTHTGTFNSTTGKPGIVLATSDPVDIQTNLTSNLALITFTFSGINRIKLQKNRYFLVLDGSQFTGNSSNDIKHGDSYFTNQFLGRQSYSTNGTTWTSTWPADMCFYLYGTPYTPTYGFINFL